MPTTAKAFGSFLLDSTNGIAIETWDEQVLIDAQFANRQLSDGATFLRQYIRGREVSLSGDIVGTSQDNARSRLDAFIAALMAGPQYLKQWSDRRLLTRIASDLKYKWVRGSGYTKLEWDLKLRSLDPWWQDVTVVTNTFSKSGAGPFTQTLSANNGQQNTPLEVRMTLTSTGVSGRSLVLTNLSTGKQLRIHGLDWNQNSAVVIDFDLRLVHDGSYNRLTPNTVEGEWWSISASGAATQLKLEHDIGSGCAIDFITNFYPRYSSG